MVHFQITTTNIVQHDCDTLNRHLIIIRLQVMFNKKLSSHRESVHLASLYRTVQKAFLYVEPFKA